MRNEGQQLLLVLRHNREPVESLAREYQVELLDKESRMDLSNADRIPHKKSFKVWGVVAEQWVEEKVRQLPDQDLPNNSNRKQQDPSLEHQDLDLPRMKLRVGLL